MDLRSIGLTIAALVGFSVTIGTSPSAAGSAAGDPCATAATTVALVACADEEYRRADQEVDRVGCPERIPPENRSRTVALVRNLGAFAEGARDLDSAADLEACSGSS